MNYCVPKPVRHERGRPPALEYRQMAAATAVAECPVCETAASCLPKSEIFSRSGHSFRGALSCRGEHRQAVNRAAADIEGHSAAAKFSRAGRLSTRETDGRQSAIGNLRARLVRHVLMRIGRGFMLHLLVLLGGHSWKLFYEGNDAPNFFISMCRTERRHTSHLDPLLDDPK